VNRNRIHNITNPYQGSRKKSLCVCSAGLLRSPTLSYTLMSEPYNRNARAVGHNKEYALIPLDPVYIAWADEIICVDEESYDAVYNFCLSNNFPIDKIEFIKLNIKDIYEAFSPELFTEIHENLVRIKYK